MRHLSESIIEFIKNANEEPTARIVAAEFGFTEPKERLRLSVLLHGMVKCGILGTTKRVGKRGVTFKFKRHKQRATNPPGLSDKERTQLTKIRARRKLGMVSVAEHLERVRQKAADKKAKAIKSVAKAETAPIKSMLETPAETVEQWMRRTNRTPEILPGLQMI